MSTGLELALVKKIVEAHERQVFLDSAPGKGAAFGFRLPVDGGADGG